MADIYWLETTRVGTIYAIIAILGDVKQLIFFVDEGPLFTPQNILSESDFLEWLRNTLPEFRNDDIEKVLRYYPSSNDTDGSGGTEFATSGYSGPSALNQSSLATGQQQRANVR